MRSQIPDLHSQIGLQERRHSFSLLNYPFEPSNERCVQPVVKTEPCPDWNLQTALFPTLMNDELQLLFEL